MLVGVDTAHFCHLDKLVFFGLNQMYQIDDKSNANLKFTKCIVVIVEPAGEFPVGFIKFDSE